MDMRRAAVVLVTCLALGGCAAGGTGSTQGAGMTSGPSPTSNAPTPGVPGPSGTPGPTSPGLTAKPVTPSSPFPGQITVRGTVSEGVELGCMLLNAENGKIYLLLGGDRQMIAKGGRLEVVGSPQPGLMTTCQQGIPFKVTQIREI